MSPFNFAATLQEGSRAQATCTVTSGDLPIYFSWLKDGEPLPSSLRVGLHLKRTIASEHSTENQVDVAMKLLLKPSLQRNDYMQYNISYR